MPQSQRLGEDRTCPVCGQPFYATRAKINRGQARHCSYACYRSTQSYRFRRGDGYWCVTTRDHGYELEHRIIMRNVLGRDLQPGEQVHHANGDPGDNRPANLRLVTCSGHIRDNHCPQRQPDKWARYKCAECGDYFQRIRTRATGKDQKHHFCGQPCFQKWRLRRMAELRATVGYWRGQALS